MSKNLNNVRVYGGLATEVWFAKKGAGTLPTTLVEPGAPFESVGWLHEDGIDLELSADIEKFKGMQGGTTLRTEVTSTEKSFKIQCIEESPLVSALYWGHEKPTVTGEGADRVARIDLPESLRTVERQAVIRFVDDLGVEKFLCCDLVQATERGTVGHKKSDLTGYEITFEIIGDSYILTNAESFLEAGVEAP
ncbi:hypothetical protein K8P10_001988 [Leucobacter sp. Psy1]|uniref:phage tail tube protein n=1 Tax=Leucobacter sp. Psy1 TaxID=2875729 RepID=UPI001CD509E1|nr:hypothetical protein [Leucobacter sp. Psy1]UBH06477.1 hypothetical protein K8P10_001988 [Leucobacter sp. Psy1]